MTRFTRWLGAAAIAGVVAAPAAAQYYPQQTYPQQTYPQQYPYPQQTYPYPQTYPQYPQQTYPQNYPGYGYNQGTGNVVTDIIDQLLGNRYNVTDRQAVRRCANAAVAQAQAQYGSGYGGYNGYNRGYGALRVTAISDVERRAGGLRVSGTLGSGGGYGQGYGQGYNGYNQGYGAGQLSFRCNVDYNGAVTGIRVRPYGAYRG